MGISILHLLWLIAMATIPTAYLVEARGAPAVSTKPPTTAPTQAPSQPTQSPTLFPTQVPTLLPTPVPTLKPTPVPTPLPLPASLQQEGIAMVALARSLPGLTTRNNNSMISTAFGNYAETDVNVSSIL